MCWSFFHPSLWLVSAFLLTCSDSPLSGWTTVNLSTNLIKGHFCCFQFWRSWISLCYRHPQVGFVWGKVFISFGSMGWLSDFALPAAMNESCCHSASSPTRCCPSIVDSRPIQSLHDSFKMVVFQSSFPPWLPAGSQHCPVSERPSTCLICLSHCSWFI